MGLSEEINKLMKGGDSMRRIVCSRRWLHKMAANLYMFGALMKDIIVSNLPNTRIVIA